MALRKLVWREPVPAAGEQRGEAVPGAGSSRLIGWSDVVGREGGGFVVLLALFGALTLLSDSFLTAGNLANLGRQVAVFGIIAVGELLVILTAGIDLSVGSVLGLASGVAAVVLAGGIPVTLGVLVGLAVGAAAGLVNGGLVAYAKLPPFIVTLGMLGMARGLVLVVTDANTIQGLPDAFGVLANGTILGVPNVLWFAIGATVLVAAVLQRTVFGRYIYATGSNAESARLAGVPVRRVQLAAYTCSGLLAGLGGVLVASRLGAGIPTAGTTYELQAIAACVIGGASLFGARGGALGAAFGALIMGTLENGGNLLGIDPFYLRIATGALIVVAVFLDQWQSRIAARRGAA